MQVVVAGATGFIGRAVVQEALARGCRVFALVRAESEVGFPAEPETGETLASVPWGADAEVLRQGFGVDPAAWVVNAAGLQRERPGLDALKIHRDIAEQVAELAQGLASERVIHLGPLPGPADNAFVRAKQEAERIIQGCGRPWSIVRSAPVFGPGDALLDEVGAWMARSPIIPRFLMDVPLQPLWVGDLAAALLSAREGVQAVGGARMLWGGLLERCAGAAGKRLIGPRLADDTVRRLSQTFGHRPLLGDLVPFNEAGFLRHRAGYEVSENAIEDLLGRAPRALEDYLRRDWPYRDGSGEEEAPEVHGPEAD
jgi:uncharacterized protein YbjT (DUF2867 family)